MSIHEYGEYNDLVNETIVRWCLLIEEIVSLLTGLSPPSADTVFLIYVSKIWTQQMMDTVNPENFHNHHLWMCFLDWLPELQLDLYKSSLLVHEDTAAKTFFGILFLHNMLKFCVLKPYCFLMPSMFYIKDFELPCFWMCYINKSALPCLNLKILGLRKHYGAHNNMCITVSEYML